MKYSARGLLLGASLLTPLAQAGDLLLWQDNSLTYLYGKNYKVDAPIQQTLTFEHASGWSFGDLFLFVDSVHFNGKGNNNGFDDSTLYGELAPRFSLGKISGADLSFGPIKDVLISTTYEFGEDDVESYLIGPAVDLDLPGFDFFQLNTYLRKTESGRPGNNVWQITPVWSYTLPLGNSDLVIDGYMDWVTDNDRNSRGDYHANLHFNPQIKYDLAKAMGWGKKFYVGIEYDYWKDKYGIEDGGFVSDNFVGPTDQNTFSFLLKGHF